VGLKTDDCPPQSNQTHSAGVEPATLGSEATPTDQPKNPEKAGNFQYSSNKDACFKYCRKTRFPADNGSFWSDSQ
jgi:hypothetical protein